MANRSFSGSLGIAVYPAPDTANVISKVQQLIQGAEYKVEPQNAGITLYHANLKDLREEEVGKRLTAIDQLIRGQRIKLGQISKVGDNFLFWEAQAGSQFKDAHLHALQLALCLNREAIAGTIGDLMKLTPEEAQNVQDYGYPFTDKQFSPRIALAYNSKGIRQSVSGMMHEATINKVVFGTMDKFSQIKEPIFQTGK